MSISLVPESAPFTPEQRAWLNGFLAGWIGLEGTGELPDGVMTAASAIPPPQTRPEAEEFPWHDPTLPIAERRALAEGKPVELRLMAAMAQLDCGACGYLCKTYAEAIASGEETSLVLCSPGGAATSKALRSVLKESPSENRIGHAGRPDAPAASSSPTNGRESKAPIGYSRKNPYHARLIRSVNLNGPASDKRTHHVEIDLGDSGISYRPGDALGVSPTNCFELVDEILAALRLSGEEPVVGPSGEVSLREALIRHRCLARPTEELIAALAGSASDFGEAATLRSLLNDDTPIAGLDVLDLLLEFPTARPGAADFSAALAGMTPRLYSISSSLRRHPGQVHLTVGRVCSHRGGRPRKGVASTMLVDRLAPGDEVRVFVRESHGFALPADPTTPIVMIGPGTGIAPFRAFLQERAAAGATGRNWLFFGDRRRDTDFLYEAELAEALRVGQLARLDLAFSRDGDRKVYVQHLMEEASAELFRWLEDGAYVYVCGDAKRMAADVDAALHRVIRRGGLLDEEGGRDYMNGLASSGRYLRDVY
ncbi:sulfite reductase subunit alpha [Tautonia plasticadhaerens]|uniref:assimilatory sulfite reductase (NADPH) n=1 Tax=Tautonia plasticadhaerens TaxID=2527974 RepID=A0A518H4G3_9BACT|nr:sulfite reductase subunit alpha [Tautonia plasticadhaerens]QDV35729.1 Sulfite reductase [NADPH] flavoprotein alpha-component [Tautonia plasticadhaerens]